MVLSAGPQRSTDCRFLRALEGIVMALCTVCGNESETGGGICRFCGATLAPATTRKSGTLHRTVNLKKGLPFVEEAVKRLVSELAIAKNDRVMVVTFIHGYGSSGKGGAIRDECRKCLDYLCSVGEIKGYIAGEEFSKRSAPITALRKRFPGLTGHRDLDRPNPGVTLVIMQ